MLLPRFPLLVLVVTLTSSCLEPGSVMGPGEDARFAWRHDRTDPPLEIVSPANDAVLFAGAPVVLRLCQDVAANGYGAIGQVECSANGVDWSAASEPFAWPASAAEFETACAGVPACIPFRLRVLMKDAKGETLVRSNEVALLCLPDATPMRSHLGARF